MFFFQIIDSIALAIDTTLTFGIAGTVSVDAKAVTKGESYKSPFSADEFADIVVSHALNLPSPLFLTLLTIFSSFMEIICSSFHNIQ